MRATEIKLCLFTTYTVDEFEAKAQELSDATTKYTEVEDRKATTAKAFKEELDRIDFEKSTLAGQVKRKGENRMIDCTVSLHEPSVGFKSIYRMDTGEFVKTEQMTRDEMQANLFPDPAPEASAAGAPSNAVQPEASGTMESSTEPTADAQGASEDETEETELPQPLEAPKLEDAEAAQAIDEAVADAVAKDEDPRAQGVRKTFGRKTNAPAGQIQ
jgi:hypothetical protein